MRTRSRATLRRLVAVASVALLLGMSPRDPAGASPTRIPVDPPGTISVSQRSTVAILAWREVEGAERYAVDYDTSPAFSSARRVLSEDSMTVITGLEPATDYHLRVASWDPATDALTAWSRTTSFTTSDRVYPLAAPVVTLAATTTSITAEWAKVDQGVRYEVSLRQGPKELGATRTVTGRKTQFEELVGDRTYQVSARAVDTAGLPVTAWSDPVSVTTPESMPLRVASYNVKCDNCRKPGEKSWASRRSAVISTIRSQEPDVLGVQEASQGQLPGRSISQFEDLLNGLGAPYAITNSFRYNCANSRSSRRCRVVDRGASLGDRIIYNTRTVTLVKQGSVKLPTTGKANLDRYLAWAVFRDKSTGKKFLFGNTHLEPGGFASLRVAQTRVVVSKLKKLATANGDLPVIVVGDFNSYKWSPGGNRPYDLMVSNGYLDPLGNTYRSRHSAPGAFVEKRINTNYSTYNGFRRNAARFPYINGTYLDYIFVTRMRVSEWETVVDVDSQGRFVGTIPSDHNMVRATVWLP